MPGPETSDRQALENFAVDNDALLDLEARVGRFNIFDALGLVHQEIRHSNFLAWLLDPAESHGLGGLFLRAVLMDLLRQTPPADRLFSPIRLDGGELTGVEVRREWRNLDLLITVEDPNLLIAVENKIRSGEHSNQLARYRETVERSVELKRFPERQYVYLTPEGDEPSEAGWTVYSYRRLHRVLRRLVDTSGDQMGDDVRAFLNHYLRLIRSRLMEDTEIAELCRDIYKNHRQAIDLIREYAAEIPPAMDEVESTIHEDPQWVVRNRGKSSISLHLIDYKKHPGWLRNENGKTQPWVDCYLEWRDQQVNWYLQVGPCRDLDLRRRVIEKLRKRAARLGLKFGGKITDQWTRMANLKIYGWKNQQPDTDKLLANLQRVMRERSDLLREAMRTVESVTAP